eukprot:TRINITY_DN15481_c0_g1_i1.p1 TRINITY_DN15481_c0_g1~~TRINITY_DN15481_c0_g1_i1.p1  ORF type:complete len:169 (-),score=37.89 TRINITY_DN15481_c0_g1_i1:27-533(-)
MVHKRGVAARVSRLFDVYWNWRMRQSPEFATLTGNKDFNHKLETFTEERFEEDFKSCEQFKVNATKLLKISRDLNDRLNLEFLIVDLSTFIEGYHMKGFYFPITYLDGVHRELQRLLKNHADVKDLRDILSRFRAFPNYVEEIINMMRIGMQKNLTNHPVSVKGGVNT